MGTRHLTLVQSDNKIKVAQYGQWDGYPSGQGYTVLQFVRRICENNEVNEFREKVNALDVWTAEQHMATIDTFDELGAKEFYAKYPEFSRDTGAEILSLIHSGAVTRVRLRLEFAGNSLFCEWAYLVNLDDCTIEVYTGFNETPLSPGDRFAGLPTVHDGYYQVRKVAEFAFDSLPTDTAFSDELDPTEE